MPSPDAVRVRVLMVEDSISDAELILRELRTGGVLHDCIRVDTRAGWESALADPGSWDIALLDYSMPSLDTLEMLGDLRERAPDKPAIVVSGTITEDRAVAALRGGARDFVSKQNLTRLAPALLRDVAAAAHVRERRAAEAALDESEARFARLVDNARDIVMRYRIRPQLVFDYVSPAVTTILGYTPEDFYADPGLGVRMIHPDDREAAAAAAAADPERPFVGRALTADGRVVWLDRQQVAIKDARGETIGLETLARDVTEQVLAHERLRSMERKFRAIFEGALDALLLADDDRVYIDANPAACDLLGVPLDEIVGRRIEEFSTVPGAVVAAGWAAFLEEGKQGGEFVLRQPNGETRMVEFTARANVEPGVHLTILRDVTARKAQEAEVVRNEERFRLAQEGAQMGVWDHDLATDVITWSDGLRDIYGVTRDASTGLESFARLVHPDDRDRIAAALLEERGGSSFEFECRLVRPDGELRRLLSRSTPIRDADGAVVRVLGVGVDVTELTTSREALRESEERLRQAQKMEAIGQLAGGIAHDFNNLLLVINGYGDMALDRCNGDDDMRHSITEIRRAGARAAELTQQLLVFSRRQVLNPEIFDLNDVVSEHASMLSRLLGEDIELEVILDASEGYVEADPGQLAQVILNLAGNARDAMADGGRLTIRTGTLSLPDRDRRNDIEAGAYATLEVSDTGCGIEVDEQAHVFEPFFTTKEVGKGTGLGLSTVLGIVEQSRGHIVVESELGQGTTFRIYLPLTGVPPVAGEPYSEHHDTGTEVVLLVEDDDVVRPLVENILLECGYVVLVAATPAEAIATADAYEDEIQLLVTDVVMPEMNGRQLAELLTERRPSLRSVYMSGYPDDTMIARGVLPAGTVFLQKPFTASQLAAKAREALALARH